MKFNPRTGRMEKRTMTMSPGTERALFELSRQGPVFERTLKELTKELKRLNDREDARAEARKKREAKDDG